MKTVAILSQKGGAGKTTLAVNMAVIAQSRGLTSAIIDLDPQASACCWHDVREAEEPVVLSAQASRLAQMLDGARDGGADLVFLDTAPHSEKTALAAARAADFILIPCRPALLDLRAIGDTVDLAKLAKKPAAVVLSCVPHQGRLADEAGEAVAAYNVPLAPVSIAQRAAFVHATTSGLGVQEYEPVGKAADEIKALFDWLCSQVDMQTSGQRQKLKRTGT